ncbi:hypothetical protein AYO20_00241 [Fonsecaea nubica]|uniref:Cytochrome P450 n=1 Tax=Fonsecaea nubica TaxID=856822 RepID=A0A178DHJ0_9EURO|nr:hypothetical protein AYO20_00241 [Fonsecaea nubica]OAL40505.1 hypothetical protein AYO20_00241 [Fonsecaea nubica]
MADKIYDTSKLSTFRGALWLFALIVIFVAVKKLLAIGRRPKGYPPGPPTIPVLGNLHQFPVKGLHTAFQKWTEEYGPIVSLKMGTQTMILCGTDEVVKELMEKRSASTSRKVDMFIRTFGDNLNIAFRDNDEIWRKQRKMYSTRLNSRGANSYIPYQEFESVELLSKILDHPSGFRVHLMRFATSIASSIAYGLRFPEADDPDIKNLIEWFDRTTALGGKLQIADWFPIFRPVFRFLPKFMNPIKQEIEELEKMETKLWVRHTTAARALIDAGKPHASFVRDLQAKTESEKDRLTEKEILFSAGHAYAAATDTQANTLAAFVKAMALYPEVQAKAQREIDAVIGQDRMPTWSDRPNLPYVRAVVEETLRWLPVTLIGPPMPHALSKTESYMGYTLPEGAAIINCIWTINNSEQRSPHPRDFDPSRHRDEDTLHEGIGINPDTVKRPHTTFGVGRRTCPGYHVAMRTLFMGMSRILWAFNISHKTDGAGNPIPIDRDAIVDALVTGPQPFQCEIKPRSAKHETMIREEWAKAERELDHQGHYNDDFFGRFNSSSTNQGENR